MKRWKTDHDIPKVLNAALMKEQEKEGLIKENRVNENWVKENWKEEYGILYPQEIADWIAELNLLKGVPLTFLVGDEMELMPESVSFFYLDENWTGQMVNGALSIGTNSGKAKMINDLFTAGLHHFGKKHIHHPRKNCIHENQLPFYREKEDFSENDKITGFIMRSRLVKLWKGLESIAVDKNGTKLNILRMEQLSEEIMLCLFHGEIAVLKVREPKEGLRFGTHENDRTFHVRDIKPGKEGVPLPDKKVQIHTNAYGRADILSLAGELKNALKTDKLTSAELAMELIVAPGLAEFTKED